MVWFLMAVSIRAMVILILDYTHTGSLGTGVDNGFSAHLPVGICKYLGKRLQLEIKNRYASFKGSKQD